MTVTLSKQQDAAMAAMKKWYNEGKLSEKHCFVLNGYAGTGKTTIARLLPELVTELGQDSVIYCAFTGKAALQLRRKGCENATTLHKLLYSPLEKDRSALLNLTRALHNELITDPEGKSSKAELLKKQIAEERRRVATPSWQVKVPDLASTVKIVVVDESSMIDAKMYNDLLALGIKIVFLGDPFQLPPVFGLSPVMQQEPDFVLTDVHRQAFDNPVLVAATALRCGEYPTVPSGQDKFLIMTPEEAGYEAYGSADQVLCGRNNTRKELNKRLRKKLVEAGSVARSDLPAAIGDKVVFLRNDHDEEIFNGSTAILKSVIAGDDSPHADTLIIDADGDQGIYSYSVWAGVLDGVDIAEAPRRTQVVDFSYALTTHKAQGSEWPSVCIHNEPIGHGNDAMRWLYTAMTRAQEKCVIVDRNK